jgi:hypothetical protein
MNTGCLAPVIHTERLRLVPLAGRHLELEVEYEITLADWQREPRPHERRARIPAWLTRRVHATSMA